MLEWDCEHTHDEVGTSVQVDLSPIRIEVGLGIQVLDIHHNLRNAYKMKKGLETIYYVCGVRYRKMARWSNSYQVQHNTCIHSTIRMEMGRRERTD